MKSVRKTTRQLQNQDGWAIISTLIAIVIGLVVIGGLFAAAKQSMDSTKVTEAIQQTQTIKINVKQAFQSEPSFAALGAGANAMLVNAGVYPQGMIRNAATGDVRNPWDGAVNVLVDATPTRFVVEYQQVPQAACIKLATGRDWFQTLANGTIVWDSTSAASNNTALATANTQCNSPTANTVRFIVQ